MTYDFHILGKIKPHVRMTQRSKWVDPRAQKYLDSQTNIVGQLIEQMTAHGWKKLPERTPLAVRIVARVPVRMHTWDLDNYIKAILDASQCVVFDNDLWIDSIRAERVLWDEYETVYQVEVINLECV